MMFIIKKKRKFSKTKHIKYLNKMIKKSTKNKKGLNSLEAAIIASNANSQYENNR